MRAHSDTIVYGSRAGVGREASGLDWFQRLCQWLKSFTARQKDIPPVSPYGIWDPRRERYYALKADAAVDMVATQNGVSWSTRIYSAAI